MIPRIRTKLTLLTIFLTLGSLGLAGQEVVESSHPIKYHEVRLNLFALPFASEFSAEYEYATAPNLSIGCTMSAYIGDKSACGLFFPTFGVMPYGRCYFGGRWFSIASPNAGFLIEVGTLIALSIAQNSQSDDATEHIPSRSKRICSLARESISETDRTRLSAALRSAGVNVTEFGYWQDETSRLTTTRRNGSMTSGFFLVYY